ncbi:MAG: sugar phosphate isomerase/epimerase [Planctomycetota bacterium]
MKTDRRLFLKSTAIAAAAAIAAPPLFAAANPESTIRQRQPIPLGFDNFSIRAHNWKAERLIRFAAEKELDSILLSDLDVYENHEEKYLAGLKQIANDLGVKVHAGTGGICPTAKRFIKKWGTAKEHLELGIRVAKTLGSPVFRCYLGGASERTTPGGIEAHIEETVKVLKSIESQAVDANVKIAVENHAGDMQGHELVTLIEAAGKHFVGATIDSGNATWTLESPASNLEVVGPYAVSSGIRDSTVWETEQGAAVAWNAVGEGQVDWKLYAKRFGELCPGVPFQLEIISGFNRSFNYHDDAFWNAYPNVKARDYESFLRMARAGKPVPKDKSNDADYQMNELLKSINFCKQELKLGLKK